MSAFNKIMEEYGALLSRVASTYEANESLQQELFQEICMAVWQALEAFKGDASIKTYILRVAHNRCITHVTKQMKHPKTSQYLEDDEGAKTYAEMHSSTKGIEQEISQTQQLNLLLTLIRKLKLPGRQVISLSLEGLNYQEIAEVTGLSANNVGVMLNRIKNDLHRQMQHD